MGQRGLCVLLFLLLQAKGVPGDGRYFHILKTCQFIEKGSQSDVNYRIQYWYNGHLQAYYNSSTEKVVGFTDYGKVFADEANKNPDYLKVRRNDLNYYCKVLGAVLYRDLQDKAVPPVSRLKSMKSNSSEDSEVLVCSAYNFYPQQIRLSWLSDGVVIPDPPHMVITEMPGGAWRYQIHSYLEHKPNAGQNITCMIEHMGLQEPQLLKLDQSEVQCNGVTLMVGGAVFAGGLLLLLVSVGFYYRKTRCDFYMARTCYLPQPELTVENLPSFLSLGKALLLLFVGEEEDKVGWRQNQALVEEMRTVVVLGGEKMERYLACWIHLGRTPAGMSVLGSYLGSMPPLPALVLTHLPSRDEIYQYPPNTPIVASSVLHWLQRVEDGTESATGLLDEDRWPPAVPFYDFLKVLDLQDPESAQQQTPKEEEEEPSREEADVDEHVVADDSNPPAHSEL